jgi:2-amino-4-hydroxy-6-hydroxymethyldihydropteridine diphosphokinase
MASSINDYQNGDLVLIALGANLPSDYGEPRQTCAAALDLLRDIGVSLVRLSRWYESAPVPTGDQPWFINAVAAVETTLDAPALLAVLHEVEERFGRTREAHWAARTLDLDLLDYRGQLRDGSPAPELPHPRMDQRAFVLMPLADVAPGWRHPRHGRTVEQLIDDLDSGQVTRPIT